MLTDEQFEILEKLDIIGFQKIMVSNGIDDPSDEIALISLHKIRYKIYRHHDKEYENKLRQESRDWLLSRNYNLGIFNG